MFVIHEECKAIQKERERIAEEKIKGNSKQELDCFQDFFKKIKHEYSKLLVVFILFILTGCWRLFWFNNNSWWVENLVFYLLVGHDVKNCTPYHRRFGKKGWQQSSHWRDPIWIDKCTDHRNRRIWCPRNTETSFKKSSQRIIN